MSVHYLKARSLWFSKWYEEGKERRRYFKTEQEARSFEAQRLTGQDEDTRLTLGELVAKYFQDNPDKHPSYRRDVVHMLAGHTAKDGQHMEGPLEWMRDKYAESLNRRDLERLRDIYRHRGASNKTINTYHTYISAILAWGVDQELITIHPWLGFKKLKVERKIFQPGVDDLRRLYAQLPEYLQWAVKTAFFLALRPGQVELFGLLWTTFNWRRGLVTVRQGKSGRLKTVVPPSIIWLKPGQGTSRICQWEYPLFVIEMDKESCLSKLPGRVRVEERE